MTVRSSSISGVGAALSVMSLLVLAGWWIRTYRRRGRSTGAESPPNDDVPAEPRDDGEVGPLEDTLAEDEAVHGGGTLRGATVDRPVPGDEGIDG